ncbi:hypothetical protein EYS14_03710 [Alteromonadaceae bacterium M269]|nr:hypothetical protein EYS14_03710 [Alteromonadaceae bacterium M269]
MLSRFIHIILFLVLSAPFSSQAQQLVPIAVGDITIFIPIGNTPVVTFETSASTSNQGSSITLSWTPSPHASPETTYEIIVTTPDGTTIVQNTRASSLDVPLLEVGQYTFTIKTCENGSCSGARTIIVTSTPVGRKVVYIHTDALGSAAAETNEQGVKQQ